MKNLLVLFAIIFTLGLISCDKDEDPTPKDGKQTIEMISFDMYSRDDNSDNNYNHDYLTPDLVNKKLDILVTEDGQTIGDMVNFLTNNPTHPDSLGVLIKDFRRKFNERNLLGRYLFIIIQTKDKKTKKEFQMSNYDYELNPGD